MTHSCTLKNRASSRSVLVCVPPVGLAYTPRQRPNGRRKAAASYPGRRLFLVDRSNGLAPHTSTRNDTPRHHTRRHPTYPTDRHAALALYVDLTPPHTQHPTPPHDRLAALRPACAQRAAPGALLHRAGPGGCVARFLFWGCGWGLGVGGPCLRNASTLTYTMSPINHTHRPLATHTLPRAHHQRQQPHPLPHIYTSNHTPTTHQHLHRHYQRSPRGWTPRSGS